MIKKDDVYRIGTIGKSHGVKGEVSLYFDDDVFDRVDADYLFLDIDGILVPFFFEEYRFKSGETALVKFEGIDSQDQARNITGCAVYFPRSLADSDEAGNMSLPEVVGYSIVDADTDMVVGEVEGIDNTTENVLFEIKSLEGTEILIPVNPEWIVDIDSDNRRITMSLPEGMLSLD